jgi:soluble lytic murein transglycosylase
MSDDREVACYALLTDHLSGKDVTAAARTAWFAQRDADNGCALLAATLMKARLLKPADAWREARLSMEMNRPRAVLQAALLANPEAESTVQALQASAARYLTNKASSAGRDNAELTTLALVKLAASNPESAAQALDARWDRVLPADLAAWAWASVAKQSAIRLSSDAPEQYDRADRLLAKAALKPTAEADTAWPDDTLAWKVRAALRANDGAGRWQQVVQAVDAMSATEQHEPAWVYWKARGLTALAKDSQAGESLRAESRELMSGIAGQLHFYGKLASEQLATPLPLPPSPAPLTAAEREVANSNGGLTRALLLIDLGLRSEGVREWNYTLRGMGDRELLAAAQRACDRELWDRCINTSDRTRDEIDMQQRFPMPFRQQVLAQTQDVGIDPAYVYGLIRQESRFIVDARSHVGASGLMQVMPATARWTAKKIGLDYQPGQITDRDTNLKIGMSYLKLVLDDFAGSQALAAAAYNAGPGRPRKWREGPTLETAAWAENIPLSETRDYVKKVLSNAAYYGALLRGDAVSLAPRLGTGVSRREASAPIADRDLP